MREIVAAVPSEYKGLGVRKYFTTIGNWYKTTSGIWKINQGHIASLSIPVPPLPEQRRLVTYLDNLQAKVDEMKRLREQAIRELDARLPSILDKAFKGEL